MVVKIDEQVVESALNILNTNQIVAGDAQHFLDSYMDYEGGEYPWLDEGVVEASAARAWEMWVEKSFVHHDDY